MRDAGSPLIEVSVRLAGRPYVELRLAAGRAVIGREAGVELRLDSGHVSRRHAALEIEPGKVTIVDTGSRNGIVIDGERRQQAQLAPGKVARIADFELTYHFLEAPRRATITDVGGGWEEYLDDTDVDADESYGEHERTRQSTLPEPPAPRAFADDPSIPAESVMNRLVYKKEAPAEVAQDEPLDEEEAAELEQPKAPLLIVELHEEANALLYGRPGALDGLAVEVIETTGMHVTGMRLLRSGESYWFGGDPGLAALWLTPGPERFPLVAYIEPGRFRVEAPHHPAWKMFRRGDTEPSTYRRGRFAGIDADAGDQVEVSCGSLAYYVRCVRPPEPPAVQRPWWRIVPDGAASAALALSLIAHTVLVTIPTLQLAPLHVRTRPATDERFVSYQAPPAHEPQPERPAPAPPPPAPDEPAAAPQIALEPPPAEPEPAPLPRPRPRASMRASSLRPTTPEPPPPPAPPPRGVSVSDFKVAGMLGHLPSVDVGQHAGRGERLMLRAYGSGGPGASKGIVGKGGGGMEITPQGTLTGAEVSRVINAHGAEIARCYQQVIDIDASAQGRVEMEWSVDIQGRVGGMRVVSDEVGSVSLVRCLRNAVRQWLFPRPRGGAAVVSFPFRFTNPRL